MDKYLLTFLGIGFIFLMTALGSVLVFFFKKDLNERFKELFLGLASGVMVAASVWSLLIPALDSDTGKIPNYVVVVIGFLLGGLFLFAIDKLVPHLHATNGQSEGTPSTLKRTSKLFLAVTIHNIPEGLSVGLAFGMALAAPADVQPGLLTAAMGLAVGIGIQNFPEGAALALPIKEETKSSLKGFLYGMFSGIVEPVAAVVGLLLAAFLTPIMPWALAFAAGAMIYVVIDELIPSSTSETSHFGVMGAMIGFAVMMVLDVALG